jgi:hypothetical protein
MHAFMLHMRADAVHHIHIWCMCACMHAAHDSRCCASYTYIVRVHMCAAHDSRCCASYTYMVHTCMLHMIADAVHHIHIWCMGACVLRMIAWLVEALCHLLHAHGFSF